jgi:hypothetical protein
MSCHACRKGQIVSYWLSDAHSAYHEGVSGPRAVRASGLGCCWDFVGALSGLGGVLRGMVWARSSAWSQVAACRRAWSQGSRGVRAVRGIEFVGSLGLPPEVADVAHGRGAP